MRGIAQQDHLTAGDIAGFLDADLTPADRLRVEAHLDTCTECRGELAAVSGLAHAAPQVAPVPDHRRPVRKWLPLTIGIALAASLAAFLLLRPAQLGPFRSPEQVRAPNLGEGRASLEIVAPGPDSVVASAALRFVWKGSAASFYRISVLTESGEPVWTADTQDTVMVLPATVVLVPGRHYFWQVEGIADGIVSSTGYQTLRVRP